MTKKESKQKQSRMTAFRERCTHAIASLAHVDVKIVYDEGGRALDAAGHRASVLATLATLYVYLMFKRIPILCHK